MLPAVQKSCNETKVKATNISPAEAVFGLVPRSFVGMMFGEHAPTSRETFADISQRVTAALLCS